MPGLPGVTTTSEARPSAWARACSRPPEPTTQTFTGLRRQADGLVAAGADADVAHRHAGQRLEEGDVSAGRLGQVGRAPDLGAVGFPTGQLLVDTRGPG